MNFSTVFASAQDDSPQVNYAYSRAHLGAFAGGHSASSSGTTSASVDPEEGGVGASIRRLPLRYVDEAVLNNVECRMRRDQQSDARQQKIDARVAQARERAEAAAAARASASQKRATRRSIVAGQVEEKKLWAEYRSLYHE